LEKLTAPAYAITDLPQLFANATAIHIQGWQYFPGHRMADGKKIPPVEVDNWIDLETSRSRHTGTGLSIDGNNIRITLGETVSDGEYEMVLDHTQKTVTFFKISDYKRMLNVHRLSTIIFGQILGEVEQLENFSKVGQEEIDGVEYEIWVGDVTHSITKQAVRFKHWLSPSTGELARTQAWSKVGSDEWELCYDYYEIAREAKLPDQVFLTEVPQGYAAQNTKETATPTKLGGGGFGYSNERYDLSLTRQISFTLSDGSVIAGWCSVDSKSESPQQQLFNGLEFGGPLPKLPVEIYALKPAGVTSNITYTGYHLACTRKADAFTEWSIYLPEGNPPPSVKQLGYEVLYRFNLEDQPKWIIGCRYEYGVFVATRQGFEKWVLGAMAELSNDGKVPENVTYETVLQLIEEIRASLSE
jgi:hypothetical protein